MPWTAPDPRWQALNPYQRAAAMSLMEADRMDPISAMHALDAMVNRSTKEGADLGEQVSSPTYQPTIEPAQQRRLDAILKSDTYPLLAQRAEDRVTGREPDFVNGATHFLAPESTMLSLEKQNPSKYKNWGPRGANWTGYSSDTGSYANVVMRDKSHAFLNPDGGDPSQSVAAAPQKPAGAFSVAASTPPPTPAPATSGAFTAAVKPPPSPPASGGAFANLGSIMGKAGEMMGSSGQNDDQFAQMAKANNEALGEEDKRQAQAMAFLLKKRQAAMGA